MEILALHIENLASLAGQHTIDFRQEPLASAGIFAITGPTGSGKSTILDALCLALYGKTPRYAGAEARVSVMDVGGNSITQNDPSSILHRGATQGSASVAFLSVDGTPYQATWSVRRARNKADGKLQAPEISLINSKTNRPIPGRKKELEATIEQLIGLSFDQFTRSVLLAQGDFTAFLKADKGSKADLLEKLTGTEIYSEISQRVFSRHKEEEGVLKALEIQQEGYEILDELQLAAIENRSTELKKAIALSENALQSNTAAINWYVDFEKLETERNTAIKVHEEHLAAQKNGLSRKRALELFEAAQPATRTLDAIHKITASEKKVLENLKQTTEELNLQEDRVQHNKRAEEEAKQRLENARAEITAANPTLQLAHKLDIQLEERTTALKHATENATKKSDATNALSQKIEENKKQIDTSKELLANGLAFRKKHEKNKSLVENQQLVLNKLQELEKKWTEKATRYEDLETANNQLNKATSILTEKNEALQTFEKQLITLTAVATNQSEAIPQVDQSALSKQISSLQEQLAAWREGITRWKTIYRLEQEISTNTQMRETVVAEIGEIENRIAKDSQNSAFAEVRRDATQKALDTARLAAAKDTKKLRDQLLPDTPCMVCGSTTHPYSTHNPQLDAVLEELKAENQQATQKLETLKEQLSSDKASVVQLQKQLAATLTTLEKQATELETELLYWNQFIGLEAALQWAPESRLEKMNEHVATLAKDLKYLENQLQELLKAKATYEKTKNQLDKLNADFHLMQQATREAAYQTEQKKEKLEQAKKDHEKVASNVSDLQKQLDTYFTQSNWIENWKADPKKFTEKIVTFTLEWQRNEEQLILIHKELASLEKDFEHLSKQLKNADEELKLAQQQLLAAQDSCSAIAKERKALFAGEAISVVRERLDNELNAAENNFTEKQKAATNSKNTQLQLKTALEGLQLQLNSIKQEGQQLQQQLADWLVAFNGEYATDLTVQTLENLLEKPNNWAQQEKSALQELDNKVLQSSTTVSEREKLLKKHISGKPTEIPLSELQLQSAELKEQTRQYHEENGDLKRQLLTDANNKKKLKKLLEKIAQQRIVEEDWQKLNILIGSSDGAKFQRIAQEFTLDILLRYANTHLNILNNRYELQRIPESLGLQVLDKDMGYEKRTVFSLSGGESFLVSLALALGLASLSSNRIKVASLFIDEGFGSLDVNTLTIAMDALERLHNDGRKVGVISHVSEMKDRIPTQVQVKKERGGKSSIQCVLAG